MDLLSMLQGAMVLDAEGDFLGRVEVIEVANGRVRLRIDEIIDVDDSDEDPDPDGGEEVDVPDSEPLTGDKPDVLGLRAVG